MLCYLENKKHIFRFVTQVRVSVGYHYPLNLQKITKVKTIENQGEL